MNKKKQTILFVFKKPRWPQEFIIKKFSHCYEVQNIFISQLIEKNNREIVVFINKFIKDNNISTVIFEGDHISIFNFDFINSINEVKKGFLLYDDFMYHDINALTASSCDFILTACPHSSLKFNKKGYKSIFIPMEADGDIFKKYNNVEKNIDVLFFGDINKHRKIYIDHIRTNNIKLKCVSMKDEESRQHEDLVKLINKSKVVINFSKSEFLKNIYINSILHKDYYQFKGRLYQAGLCGTAVVTEYSPAHKIVFNENELIDFNNKEECVQILKKILADEKKIQFYSNNLYKKCLQLEDKNYIKEIKNFIDSVNLNKNGLKIPKKFPFWYKWIFVKQRIWLRFRLNKFISFFKEVFDVIFAGKNNSLIEFLLFSSYSVFYSLLFLIRYPLKKIKNVLIR